MIAETFTVYTLHGAVVEDNINAARAAELIDVQEEDLAWAIENYGCCAGPDLSMALPFGERFQRTSARWR